MAFSGQRELERAGRIYRTACGLPAYGAAWAVPVCRAAWAPAFFAAWAAIACGAIAHAQQPADADQKVNTSPRSADELVRQALRSRTLGDGDSTALLERARAADPRSEPAHWQSGFVRESNGWIKYDAVADGDGYRRLLDRYETERLAHPNTLTGHAAMANWCREQKLPMQERAHWFKVLEFVPDHGAARATLGFVRVGDKWVARSEIESTRLGKLRAEQAFKKWSAALKPIRLAFESGDPARMAAARQKLAAIRDVDAIPAMETMLSGVNLDAASAVVFTIRQLTGPDAAIGLARQAVFGDWYPAGKEAAEALRDHDELSYVPLLLSALATPPGDTFKITTHAYPGVGRLLVRYEFERERQDRTEKVTYDVSYGVWTYSIGAAGKTPLANMHPYELSGRPTVVAPLQTLGAINTPYPQAPVDTRPYYNEVLGARAETDQAKAAGRIEEESRTTKDLNARICRALRTATSNTGPEMNTDDPRTWWDWWTKRREVFVAGQKPVSYSNFVAEAAEYVPRYSRPLVLPLLPAIPRTMSCLVAGTTVYTDVGPRPVEQIRLGDRVLSQNVETGELAYRVVLEPTVRPAAPTVVLKFGDRKIQATGGHPFWAVGRGWMKAREFEPGMRLASVGGTVEVTAIEPAANLPAYNLVVDEFHTYFVGDDLVLSHDNRPPEPTRGGLPGETVR